MSIVRSQSLNNLPRRKVEEKILSLVQSCKTCSGKNITRIEQAYDGVCENCSIMLIAYNRYADSNIPLDYWSLEMKDFAGSKTLKNAYDGISQNISKMYSDGMSICFSGTNGTGKTLTATNILKLACQKNYDCLYSTFNDMINVLIDSPHEDRYYARRELMMCDWLVCDELDPKYVPDGAADLFGRTIEHVFRTRSQNNLPTIFCSNSPNIIEMFKGSIKQSIESLFHKVKIIPILAEDYRKIQGK